jgi:hypothetical protein
MPGPVASRDHRAVRRPVRTRLRRLGSALIPWGVAIFLLFAVGSLAARGPLEGLSNVPPEAAGLGDYDLLDPGYAALALLAWIGAAFAASYVLLRPPGRALSGARP